jgi:hypothetical protein
MRFLVVFLHQSIGSCASTLPLMIHLSQRHNGGNAVTCDGSQSLYFILQNLGLFQDLWLELRDITGNGFSLTADLAPFYNCEANGLLGNG